MTQSENWEIEMSDKENMKETIDKVRMLMGTLPDDHPKLETKFYRGVEAVKVKLIDHSVNPYKAMFTMATSTWGKKIDKWEDTEPLMRFLVNLAVLSRNALPLAYEAPAFMFAVNNVPRWAFDQIARARIGAVFSSMGSRDNCHSDGSFHVQDPIVEMQFSDDADERHLAEDYYDALRKCKDVYARICDSDRGNWQIARDIFPISNDHRFGVNMNFAALQNFCSRRMKFCEAAHVVAVAWLMREEVAKVFPLMSKFLRPGCDFSRSCQYSKGYALSELFGCLFKPCGRHPVKDNDYEYATFNESCANIEAIEKQLKISIPRGNEDMYQVPKISSKLLDQVAIMFNDVDEKDNALFYAN